MCFKRVKQYGDPSLYIWNELGASYVKLNQVKKAIKMYEEAIDTQYEYIELDGVLYPNILYLDACEQLVNFFPKFSVLLSYKII